MRNIMEIGKTFGQMTRNEILTHCDMVVGKEFWIPSYDMFLKGPGNFPAEILYEMVKGIIVLQICRKSSGGSVNPATYVLFALAAADYSKAKEVIQWAEEIGYDCSYFPYGSSVEGRTMYFDSYVSKYSRPGNDIEEIFHRPYNETDIKKSKRENWWEDETKIHQKRKKIAKKWKENDLRDRMAGERKRLIERLNEMDIVEKLTVLANDTEHTPKYYPLNIVKEVTLKTLQALDEDIKSKLKQKFETVSVARSPWGKVKRLLWLI